MKFVRFLLCFLLLQIAVPSDSLKFKTRVSFLNIGLDYTKYSDFKEIYRSVFVVPVMLERKNFEIGLYINPFIKEKYDSFGNYQYDSLLNSYLLNFRFRYIKNLKDNINTFIDFAYCDERLYGSRHLYWTEIGFIYRLSPLIKLVGGYKHDIYSNSSLINLNSFFVNFIIGHSFLRRR